MLPVLVFLAMPARGSGDPILPPRFEDVPVIEGLSDPVAVRFGADGTIFVAEKAGRVKLFDPLPTPGAGVVVLDISDQVMDYQDRGLLGLAIHPQYPEVPFIFVLYTYDAPPGGVAAVWNDRCDDPTGSGAGCVVSGRLARYTMVDGPSGPKLVDERILIRDEWYQQYPSHSIGDLAFGPDGMLYVSGGDGASYQFVDTGDASQINRSYPNPGDPPGEGGALRSQDLLTGDDALGVNGSILRIDPGSGEAAPDNPLAGVRQIAFGLRNPFRIGFRPGTRELWIGDVGENVREEVNRVADVTDTVIENFGWPCYEGLDPHPGYDGQPSCVALINDGLPPRTPGTKTSPVFSYVHGEAPGHDMMPEGCQNGTSQAISGIAFYRGGNYPGQYQHALFFADYGVNCIYAMRADANGVPDPSQIDVVERAAELPVSLEVGPGGDIFYASIAGAIRRIAYGAELTAKATADPITGEAPLTVQFDGSRSLDTLGGALAYAWDLDGDGAFDDSTLVRPQRTYTRGVYSVRLQVTNRNRKTAVSAPIVVTAGERPVAAITIPASDRPWRAGQRITFAGTATDDQDGALPPRAMTWRITLLHCPLGGCHPHPVATFDGVDGGSFVAAPDGYPAHYDIELTATDSSGLVGKTTVRIDALGTELTFQTVPSGLALRYAGSPVLTPEHVTEVAGYEVSIEAPSPVAVGEAAYVFTGWSDGGARAHSFAVPDHDSTYIATYELDTDRDGLGDSMDPCPAVPDRSCSAEDRVGGGFGCSTAAGATSPGVGALIVLGFVSLVRLGSVSARRTSARRPIGLPVSCSSYRTPEGSHRDRPV